jgi:hypothetical protein
MKPKRNLTKNRPQAGQKRALAVAPRSASVRELRAISKTCKPGVIAVSHILPRAYCVAKPAAYCAVFAVPACDREPQVRDDPWATVQNESARDVKHGDWCSLAYVSTSDGTGEMRVLPNFSDQPPARGDVAL